MPLYAPVAAERRLALAYDADGDGITDVFDFVPVGPGSSPSARSRRHWRAPPIRSSATLSGSRSTGARWSTPGTPAPASGSSTSRARRTCCWPEAAHPPGQDLPAGLHLTGREAGEHAAAAGVGRLLLTHIPAWVDEIGQLFAASAVFSETELVHTGATYEI